jgi:hypothetical protein
LLEDCRGRLLLEDDYDVGERRAERGAKSFLRGRCVREEKKLQISRCGEFEMKPLAEDCE